MYVKKFIDNLVRSMGTDVVYIVFHVIYYIRGLWVSKFWEGNFPIIYWEKVSYPFSKALGLVVSCEMEWNEIIRSEIEWNWVI